jgi:hypothetical protein
MDSTATPAEAKTPPKPEPVRLKTLYERLMAQYPQSPQAPQAGRILEALQERLDARQALADSLAADSLAAVEALARADTLAQGADSLALVAADTLARADTLAQATADQTATPSDSGAVDKGRLLRSLDDRQDRVERARPNLATDSVAAVADWTRGGYTVIVASEKQRVLAERTARRYRQTLRAHALPVDVLVGEAEGTPRYRVAVGQAETSEKAQALHERLAADLPSDAWIFHVEPAGEPEDPTVYDEPVNKPVEARDTLAVPGDSMQVAPAPGAAPNQPAAEPPSVGLGNIDWSQGGWTIVIHAATTPAQAEGFARNFSNYVRDLGHPIDIFTASTQEGVAYQVGVGLFGSERDVEEAFARLKDRLPGDAQVVQIPKKP